MSGCPSSRLPIARITVRPVPASQEAETGPAQPAHRLTESGMPIRLVFDGQYP